MLKPTAADISELCDKWCAATSLPGGGMAIGGASEKYRLLANDVQFHELDYKAVCAAIVGLSRVLLRPGLNTIIDQDHYALWGWCGELLLGITSNLFPHTQYEIKSLYETTLHAALANCRKPVASRQEWEEQNRIRSLQPHHASELLTGSGLVVAYLAFPLLEAVLKRACSNYVAFDGKIIASFSVPSRQGNRKVYDPTGKFRTCSSLRDLLILFYEVVASDELKQLLDEFKAHIEVLDPSQEPFDVLYSWRNQSLHGSTNFQTIGGTLLNLSLLISMSEIETDYEKRRIAALEHCRREAQHSTKSRWSFYPPY